MLRRDMRPLFLPGGDEPLASVSAVLSSLAELCRRSFGVELFRRTWQFAMRLLGTFQETVKKLLLFCQSSNSFL